MKKKSHVLEGIRKSIAPRKKRNSTDEKVKDYAVIRIPKGLKRDLDILKLAYELMWSEGEDISLLSPEQLETWVMEYLTQEEFFKRLYYAALRTDPDLEGKGKSDAPDYLSRAKAIYESRQDFDKMTRADIEEYVKNLERRAKGNGTSLTEEALKEQEEAKTALEEDLRATAVADSPAPTDQESPEPVVTPEVPADPTEGDVWKKEYYFERDGIRIEAVVGTKGAAFYCRFNGRDTGIRPMMYNHHFKFYNSDGVELTREQAEMISERIKAHNAES